MGIQYTSVYRPALLSKKNNSNRFTGLASDSLTDTSKANAKSSRRDLYMDQMVKKNQSDNEGYIEISKQIDDLLNSGADVNKVDQKGRTIINRLMSIYVVKNGNVLDFRHDVDRLLAAGADLNLPDDSGRTPVSYLVEGKGSKITLAVAFLVGRGADLTKEDKLGFTPMNRALRSGEHMQAIRHALKVREQQQKEGVAQSGNWWDIKAIAQKIGAGLSNASTKVSQLSELDEADLVDDLDDELLPMPGNFQGAKNSKLKSSDSFSRENRSVREHSDKQKAAELDGDASREIDGSKIHELSAQLHRPEIQQLDSNELHEMLVEHPELDSNEIYEMSTERESGKSSPFHFSRWSPN